MKLDLVTRLGTIRLRVARTEGKGLLPRGPEPFQQWLTFSQPSQFCARNVRTLDLPFSAPWRHIPYLGS